MLSSSALILLANHVAPFCQDEKLAEPSDASPCNLMVKYLPERIDSDDALRALFAPFGEILKCKLIVEKNTGGRVNLCV